MSHQRQFSVLSIKSLQRRQSYRIVIDFNQCTVSFHKVKKNQEVRRQFLCIECIKLEKHIRDNTLLTVTFNTNNVLYIKNIQFLHNNIYDNNGNVERDLFCDLIHAVIVTGNKPYKVWKSLHSNTNDNNITTTRNDNNQQHALNDNNIDFYTFLISFSTAHTQQQQQSQNENSKSNNADNDNSSNNNNNTSNNNIDNLIVNTTSPRDSLYSTINNYNTAPSNITSPILPSAISTSNNSDKSQQHYNTWSNNTALNSMSSNRQSTNTNNINLNEVINSNNNSIIEPTYNPVEDELYDIDGLSLLLGETIAIKQGHVTYIDQLNATRGDIYLTNYRLIYSDYANRRNRTQSRVHINELDDSNISIQRQYTNSNTYTTQQHTSIVLGHISRIIRTQPSQLRIVCKDNHKIELSFDASSTWVDAFYRHIILFTFPKQLTQLFAYVHTIELTHDDIDGWSLYNFIDEYKRIGLLPNGYSVCSKFYRITNVNQNYMLCKSYPQQFIVPASIDDNVLQSVSQFRSRERIPTAMWLHPQTHASLIRCSQPLTGLRGKRSYDDELLISAYRDCNPYNSDKIYIMDAYVVSNNIQSINILTSIY